VFTVFELIVFLLLLAGRFFELLVVWVTFFLGLGG
jgi:hypothetical protein